jgi:hydroxymethylpyrimidine pyrophosphatase-like HAD family hydrolase
LIQLFITDIDGCLLEPMKTPQWDILTKIRSLNEQSRHDSAIPSLTLCTGRPLPYAEAIAQMMGIEQPFVFENAGVFDPVHYRIHLDETLTDETRRQITDLKQWLKQHIMGQYTGFTLEFSKLMDAGVIHPDKEMILQVLPTIQKHVAENYGGFEIHHTDVSINIILGQNNKESGIRKLCRSKKISHSQAAYIGDSSGDVSGLKIAGRSFAPSNAVDQVKQVSRVLPYKNSEAVLEAYTEVIKQNRR